MGTSATTTQTYGSVPWAVMPGSVVRGGVVGLPYSLIVMVLFAFFHDTFEGTTIGTSLDQVLDGIGWGGVWVIGLLCPIVASLFLTFLGYSRRKYELGADGITEHRGLVLTSNRFIPYDDIDEVNYTQSKVQGFYGTGTLRIIDVNTVGEEDTTKLPFVKHPESVYTNVLRNIADETGVGAADGDLSDVGENPMDSENLSRLDDESLAAGTGFQYMMPETVLHPEPWKAARFGALKAVLYSAVGLIVVYLLRGFITSLLDFPTLLHYLGGILAVVLVLTGINAGRYYWKYDTLQYELYEDHIRRIFEEEKSSVALSEVESIEAEDGLVRRNDIGNIALIDDEGDTVMEFKFFTDPDGLRDSLTEWTGLSGDARNANTAESQIDGGRTQAGQQQSETDDAMSEVEESMRNMPDPTPDEQQTKGRTESRRDE
jgi:membrane protein YdbS with pleckstrin-like domain